MAGLLAAAILAGACAAAGGAPGPTATFYHLTLAKALPGDRDLEVYLEVHGGRVVAAVGRAPTFSKAPVAVEASRLAIAAASVAGEMAITLPSDGYSPPPGRTARGVYALAVRIDGAALAGTFAGRFDAGGPQQGPAGAKGTVRGTVGAPPALDGAVRLELDLINAAGEKAIDRKVWSRRGLLYLTLKGGRCIQAIAHGHGDARQVNYFEAAVTASKLSLAAGRLTGTVTVRSTRGRTYVYTFDAPRAGGEIGGAFAKTVGGKQAPGGLFVGRLGPVPAVPADEAIYNIELLGAVAGGRQLNCFVPRTGGVFGAGLAYSGAWNHMVHDVSPAGLALRGGALTGEMKVTMNPDAYVPRDGKAVAAAYAVNARVGDGCVTGTFTGTFGGEKVSGAVVGRLAALPAVPEPARFRLKLEDGVNEGAPWLRRVYVSFVATGGRADEGSMSNNKGGWKGTFQRALVRVADGRFCADIAGTVDESRSVRTGRYVFKLAGRAVGRELVGTVETWRDGKKTKAGTPFMGSFAPAE